MHRLEFSVAIDEAEALHEPRFPWLDEAVAHMRFMNSVHFEIRFKVFEIVTEVRCMDILPLKRPAHLRY